jgi:hypothetical protein
MKENLGKLHAQRLFWKPHNRNVLCWEFYCVNDNTKVDLTTFQVMHCILCLKIPIFLFKSKNQARRG